MEMPLIYFILTISVLILTSHQFVPKYEELPWKNLTTDMKWIKEAVAKHNLYRAKHGACPLVLNLMLCEISQGWADQLSRGARDGHSNNILDQYVGENVYIYRETISAKASALVTNVKTTLISGAAPVDDWYNEISDYDFKTGLHLEGHSDNIGHFTQVVWKETREVGIAYSVPYTSEIDGVKYKTVAAVASYYPTGNEIPYFQKNVVPAGAPKPTKCPAPRVQAKVRSPVVKEADSGTTLVPAGPKDGTKAAEAMEKFQQQKLEKLRGNLEGITFQTTPTPKGIKKPTKKPNQNVTKKPTPNVTKKPTPKAKIKPTPKKSNSITTTKPKPKTTKKPNPKTITKPKTTKKPITKITTKPKPKNANKPNLKTTTKPKPKTTKKPNTKTTTKPKPKTTKKSNPKTTTKPKPKPKTTKKPKPTIKPKSKITTKPKPKTTTPEPETVEDDEETLTPDPTEDAEEITPEAESTEDAEEITPEAESTEDAEETTPEPDPTEDAEETTPEPETTEEE